jgi:hypothetical protein
MASRTPGAASARDIGQKTDRPRPAPGAHRAAAPNLAGVGKDDHRRFEAFRAMHGHHPDLALRLGEIAFHRHLARSSQPMKPVRLGTSIRS